MINISIMILNINNNWLVVSIPLKNMKVKWAYYSQYMEKS